LTVERPQLTFVVTQPSVAIGTETIHAPTMATGGLAAPGYEWVGWFFLIILLVILVVGIAWYGRSKKGTHPKEPDAVRIFCIERGAENPTTNEYCGTCGKRLVARSIR
jgi:hypothetical protein